jgi:hypothetical protein
MLRLSEHTPRTSITRLPTRLAHPLQDALAVVIHVIGPPLQGQRQNCGEPGRLFAVEISSRGLVVVAGRRTSAVNTGTPFDYVEVELKNTPLAQDKFGRRDKRELGGLAQDRAARSEEQVFYQLLRKGGPSAKAAALPIVFGSNLHRMPIESMMFVEVRVFRGDHRVLQIERDLTHGYESVAFVIRLMLNPRLQAALDMHGCRRRVDPPGSYKNQHSKQPKKRQSDNKPANE